MKDGVAARRTPRAIADSSARSPATQLAAELLELATAFSGERTSARHLVPPRAQLARHVLADEARRAGDERLHEAAL